MFYAAEEFIFGIAFFVSSIIKFHNIMFEKVLEKILLQHFGKFIQGFDKQNISLGVWSGNVMVENVMLRPEIIE